MENLNHLDKNKIENICLQLWEIRGALKGIGGLLEQQVSNPCYLQGELSGLGQLLKKFSDDISKVEDILRCGEDSE